MTTKFIRTVNELLEREFDVNETVNLLRQYGFRYLSWGVSKLVNYSKKSLILKVNGHHHKSYVVITLSWDDTYSVYIINNRGVILDTYKMVYFDQLFDIIDKRIERIPEYVR